MKDNYKRTHLKSGFNVSIQASERSYCEPRNNTGPYTSVELGFPSAPDSLIIGYAEDSDDPTGTVYGWVPVGVVQALISKHGGIEEGALPEFDIDPEQAAILAETLLEIENESR
jgi:hypothetical protein